MKYICASLLFLLLPNASLAQGSGSNASQSLLQLDDPIESCLTADAKLTDSPENDPIITLEKDTDALVWAVTFDQAWLEVEYEGDFFFVSNDQVVTEPCKA